MSETKATVIAFERKPAQGERRIAIERRANNMPGPDFAFLANSIPQLVWTAQTDGHCDYFNQRWFDYTGITFEQSAGNGWQYVIHPEDLARTNATWQEANRTGQECVVEHRLRSRTGEYRWNLTKAMPMRNSDGSIMRWFGTCTDIHEQKDTASREREATRKSAKQKLANRLAHEINNPLNAAMNMLYLAKIKPREAKKYVQSAEEQLRKVAELTAQILGRDVADRDAG